MGLLFDITFVACWRNRNREQRDAQNIYGRIIASAANKVLSENASRGRPYSTFLYYWFSFYFRKLKLTNIIKAKECIRRSREVAPSSTNFNLCTSRGSVRSDPGFTRVACWYRPIISLHTHKQEKNTRMCTRKETGSINEAQSATPLSRQRFVPKGTVVLLPDSLPEVFACFISELHSIFFLIPGFFQLHFASCSALFPAKNICFASLRFFLLHFWLALSVTLCLQDIKIDHWMDFSHAIPILQVECLMQLELVDLEHKYICQQNKSAQHLGYGDLVDKYAARSTQLKYARNACTDISTYAQSVFSEFWYRL